MRWLSLAGRETSSELRQPADTASAGALRPATRAATLDASSRRGLISPTVVRGSARVVEFLGLCLLGFAIAFLYVPAPDLWASSQYLIALIATALITVTIFEALGAYTVSALSTVVQPMTRLLLGWTIATGLLVAAVFFLKIGAEFSRVWLALWFGIGAFGVISTRALFSIAVRDWVQSGRLNRRAVVYGSGASTQGLLDALASDPRSDVSILGVFDDRAAFRDADADAADTDTVTGYPRMGTLDELVSFARATR
ncbi:MAG: hypothetical protein AAFV26_00290, partial [Pseudomonadota bacterium]